MALEADPGTAEAAVAAYRRAYPDLALSQTRPVPGIAELLELDGRMTLMVVPSCGIATIGVTWGIGDDTVLRNAGADVIVDQPQALSTHPFVKAA